MSLLAAEPLMDERKSIPFQIKCEPRWLNRLKRAARKMGVSAAAYMRVATNRMMDADGIPEEPPKKPKR